MTLDAITVFQTADGRPANKIVTRLPDGSVKSDKAPEGGRFVASTVQVPDLETLAAVLREVGKHPNMVISLSVFRDAPEGEFAVVSAPELAEHLGVKEYDREALTGFHDVKGMPTAARIKESMQVGNWLLFDRDMVDGMPTALAKLSFEEWREAVDLLFPGFATCGYVKVLSTKTRVTSNGEPIDPTASSCHVFVKIDDPSRLKDAWSLTLGRAAITEFHGELLGFFRPRRNRATGEVINRSWWTIYDRSTWSVARLVFDGAPTVRGDGLEVPPPLVDLTAGPALELTKMPVLMPRKEKGAIEEALEQFLGTRPTVVPIQRAGKIVGIELTIYDMTMDLKLDTERGPMTVGQLQKARAGHVRCQSPYRNSTSWAAYYNVHHDGSPFVFDTGTGEKHVLKREGLPTISEIIRDSFIEELQPRSRYQDDSIFSDTWRRRVELREIGGPPEELINRMMWASDAPCEAKGQVKRSALPPQYRNWRPTAWATMARMYPLADEIEVMSEPAAEEFREQIATMLTAMHRMNSHGGESKSFGSWAYVFAAMHPGYWQRVPGLELWGRILDDSFLIAIRPKLATQTARTFPEIGKLSLNQLTRRCRAAKIAVDGDNKVYCNGREIRAAILSAEFVLSLELDYDLSDPIAAALRSRLDPETEVDRRAAADPFAGSGRPGGGRS
jgi:hypothetical protein